MKIGDKALQKRDYITYQWDREGMLWGGQQGHYGKMDRLHTVQPEEYWQEHQ